MKLFDASRLAKYLNTFYRGPDSGLWKGAPAFVEQRSCCCDSDGYWDYYITSPFGAFDRVSGKHVAILSSDFSDVVINAKRKLGIEG